MLTSFDICQGLWQDGTDPQHAIFHLLFAGAPAVFHEVAQCLVQLLFHLPPVFQTFLWGAGAALLLSDRVGIPSSGEELRSLFGRAVCTLVS